MKYGGIHCLQRISSQIVVTIACGTEKTCFSDLIVLHGLYNFELIVFRGLIDLFKTLFQRFTDTLSHFIYFFGNSKLSEHFLI